MHINWKKFLTFASIIIKKENMAYFSSGNTNLELVDALYKHGVIKSEEVLNVMKKVDRANFCFVRGDKKYAYCDEPQPIGYGATISAPHMHAYALNHLIDVLRNAKRALDVGSGSGYLTVCMAYMMPSSGKIYGIEHIPELVAQAKEVVHKYHPSVEKSIEFMAVDGRLGLESRGPYDCIHVGAAAYEGIPQALLNQLANGGKLFIPVGPPGDQEIVLVTKDSHGTTHKQHLCQVRYVPLTGTQEQLDTERRMLF